MSQNCERVNGAYNWSRRDKVVYSGILIPFTVAFIGAAYLLATESPYLVTGFILLYIAVNIFQAGCCIGCPYRGSYCPPIFGLYSANLLSSLVYRSRDLDQRFFRINADLAVIFLLITIVFPVYWLIELNWLYLLGFLILLAIHAGLFLSLICPRCSYNDTCPRGQTSLRLFNRRDI